MAEPIDKALESDLDRALKDDMANEGLLAPINSRVRQLRSNHAMKDKLDTERASDQLATAVKGLLQVEGELLQLVSELAGEVETEPSNPEELTREVRGVLPRLRSDAEILARLAIRIHKHIESVRAKL